MTFLHDLPNEIILLIANSLTIREVGRLCLVNRQLHTAARYISNLLCWACETGKLGLVERLHAAGADPNIPFHKQPAEISLFRFSRTSILRHINGPVSAKELFQKIYDLTSRIRSLTRISASTTAPRLA
jgi:hypothetical protein